MRTDPAGTETAGRARCLIVDDESPAREELRYLLAQFPHVQVIGEATTAQEALELLRSVHYDVVFLDIRMPGGSGLEVARALQEHPNRPAVVFTTAYPDHAVEAFDLAAADYLLKPFDASRLGRTLERVLLTRSEDDDVPSTSQGPPVSPTAERLRRLPVQRGERTALVSVEDIVYATAGHGYCHVKLADERVLVNLSLTELAARLPRHFFRAHRSCIVNLERIRELVPNFKGALTLVMDDRERSSVAVSRRQARQLRHLLGI